MESPELRVEIVATLTEKDGLGGAYLLSCVDEELWIGGDTGISIYDINTGAFRYFTTEQGLPAPTVKALLHASDDSIWIGTKGKGIARLKDGKMTLYDHLYGLVHDQVRAIMRREKVYSGSAPKEGPADLLTVTLPTSMRMTALRILRFIISIKTLRGCCGSAPMTTFRYQGERFDR